MSNSKQGRQPDLKLGLKQHTLRGWQPAPEYISLSIYFNADDPAFFAKLSSLIETGGISLSGDIHPQVKLVESPQLFENCFNGKTQKNDATRKAFAPNDLVGYVKVPEKKATITAKTPAPEQEDMFNE